MTVANELLELKEKIADAKVQQAELSGVLKQLHQELKDEFDCGNLRQAKQKLLRMKKEQEKLENEISEGLEKLREEYDL